MTPLKEIRVLEFTLNISGALTGQILASFGAEVTKIERIGTGDDCRSFGPPFVSGASVMYNAYNRGKSSVTLDLKTEEAIEWVHRQLAECDVLIENMRPGNMQELGLGQNELRARYPRLVYCSLSAFGSSGPWAARPGYEEVVQAFSGLFSVNGAENSPTSRVGAQILDMGTGVWAALGCVVALMARNTTGKGAIVTGSLLETGLGWLTLPLGTYSVSKQLPARSRSGGASVAPYRCFAASDGEIVIAAINDRLFIRLCSALGHPEWAVEERFKKARSRASHRLEIHALIEPIVAQQDRAFWLEKLGQAGVPCSPVNNLEDVLSNDHVRQLDLFAGVAGSDLRLVTLPISIDNSRGIKLSSAPALGSANQKFGLPVESKTEK